MKLNALYYGDNLVWPRNRDHFPNEYLSGRMKDYKYPEEKVKEALASLPEVPGA